MIYQIEITSTAKRDLSKLPKNFLKQIDRKILALAENPYPPDVKKIKGHLNLYRIRSGDYRLIYQINKNILIVIIVRVRHRKDIYKKL